MILLRKLWRGVLGSALLQDPTSYSVLRLPQHRLWAALPQFID